MKKILLLCFLTFILFACGKREIQVQKVSVELWSELFSEMAASFATIKWDEEKNHLLNAIDTTAPVITIKETEFLEGTKVTAEDLVEVSDSSEIELFLYSNESEMSEIALESVFVFWGDTFRVKAVDKYGNESIKEIVPKIKSLKEEGDIKEKINAENYLHKVWVLDHVSECGWGSDFTFVIESVKQNRIYGRMLIYTPYEMELTDSRTTRLDGDIRGWEFAGVISGNYAQCRFENGDGQDGTLCIWFLDNGDVEAEAVYDDASLNVDIISRDLFSPYNISDLDDIYHINNSFKANIDFYGSVYIMCGKSQSQSGGKFYPVAYIADKDGNIFYEFDANFLMEIVNAYTGDFNADGKTDVKIIVDYEDCSDEELGVMENYFIQTEGGFFDWYRKYEKEELSLDKKLRESP